MGMFYRSQFELYGPLPLLMRIKLVSGRDVTSEYRRVINSIFFEKLLIYLLLNIKDGSLLMAYSYISSIINL